MSSFKGSSYDEKYKSIFMTARQKAEERNTRLMGELDELHNILKKDSDHKQKKANFNNLKVVQATLYFFLLFDTLFNLLIILKL